jgi:hypothetical protein
VRALIGPAMGVSVVVTPQIVAAAGVPAHRNMGLNRTGHQS